MSLVITYHLFTTFFLVHFLYREWKLWPKCPFIHYLQFLWVQAKLRAEEAKREAESKAAMEAKKQAAIEAEKSAAVEAERRAEKEATETSKRVTSGGTQQATAHPTGTASSLSNAETKESGIAFLY